MAWSVDRQHLYRLTEILTVTSVNFRCAVVYIHFQEQMMNNDRQSKQVNNKISEGIFCTGLHMGILMVRAAKMQNFLGILSKFPSKNGKFPFSFEETSH